MSKSSPANPNLSFEKALERLEGLVEAMEGGGIPLDQLVAKFEEGTELLRHCQRKLGDAELKVEKLRQASPTPELEDLDSGKGSDQG